MKPDKAKARSLLAAATQDIRTAKELSVHEHTARTIVRNVYEAFRMLGEARLALAGIKSADHDTQIQEILRLDIATSPPLRTLEHLKQLRHAINYKGYQPDPEEVKEALLLAQKVFSQCHSTITQECEKSN